MIQGIRNIIEYWKIIWSDRNYDYDFLVRLMEFKLKRMATHFEEHKRHVGWEQIVKQVRYSESLCKRISEDEPFGSDKIASELLGKEISRHILLWWD